MFAAMLSLERNLGRTPPLGEVSVDRGVLLPRRIERPRSKTIAGFKLGAEIAATDHVTVAKNGTPVAPSSAAFAASARRSTASLATFSVL